MEPCSAFLWLDCRSKTRVLCARHPYAVLYAHAFKRPLTIAELKSGRFRDVAGKCLSQARGVIGIDMCVMRGARRGALRETCVKGAHQGLRPGEVHRSLGMSNAGECKGDQSRPHYARGTE